MYLISISEVRHGKNPHAIESLGHPRADPPDLNHWQSSQDPFAGGDWYAIPHAHSPKGLDLLGGHLRQLRQGLGLGDPHTNRQPGELQDFVFDSATNGVQLVQGATEPKKRFIDGIHFDPRRKPRQDAYWYWRISICSLLNRVDCVTAGYTLLGASWACHCAVPRRRKRFHDAPCMCHGS